jgi:hypothetical protein
VFKAATMKESGKISGTVIAALPGTSYVATIKEVAYEIDRFDHINLSLFDLSTNLLVGEEKVALPTAISGALTYYAHQYGRSDKANTFSNQQGGLDAFLKEELYPPCLSKLGLVRDRARLVLAYRITHFDLSGRRETGGYSPSVFGGAPRTNIMSTWKPIGHSWVLATLKLALPAEGAVSLNVPSVIKIGQAFEHVLTLQDDIVFRIDGAPDGMTLDLKTKTLRFSPEARHIGRYTVTLIKSEASGEAPIGSF